MIRDLRDDWEPAGDPFSIECDPAQTVDSVNFLVALVCFLVIVYGGELLLAWR